MAEVKKATVADNTNFSSKTVTALNSTSQSQVEFLQHLDELLLEQITDPVHSYSLTILYNINEYNKVLKHILSKLLAKSVLTRIRMLPTAEIVCTKLKPKFISKRVKYVYTKNTFKWDDFDMRGLLALIKTAKEIWTDITQAIELVKIQKLNRERHRPTLHRSVS